MEIDQMESGANGGGGGFRRRERCWEVLCSAAGMLWAKVVGLAGKLARIARDDPRRVAHSFKVGLALTLVSVLYYVRPLFNNWGVSTMWAVLTTVVVMEYTVGTCIYTYVVWHGRCCTIIISLYVPRSV
jgi:hypothetical protein